MAWPVSIGYLERPDPHPHNEQDQTTGRSRSETTSARHGSAGGLSAATIGPIVINGTTSKPYHDDVYVRKFAKVRAEAGLPSSVWSMDTRAGAVSETVAATGSLDGARILATHTTVKMTERYSRRDRLEEVRKIAEARASIRLPKSAE